MTTVIIQDEFNPALPLIFRWNLPTSGTNVEFVLPSQVKKISLRFESNAGTFTFDSANSATHYGTVDANSWLEINLALRGLGNTARPSMFLAPSSNNTIVQILLEG